MARWLLLTSCLLAAGCGPSRQEREEALKAFTTVQQVLQHPRCRNCHVPGDAPLQFDAGIPHEMSIVRGPDGHGTPGLACWACHGSANPPASYGIHAPPGAPHWKLPPPETKMVFADLSPAQLCETIKNGATNGGRTLEESFEHVAKDPLVLWGWDPGGARAPVPWPHAEFVAAFRTWMDAGAPCPDERVASN